MPIVPIGLSCFGFLPLRTITRTISFILSASFSSHFFSLISVIGYIRLRNIHTSGSLNHRTKLGKSDSHGGRRYRRLPLINTTRLGSQFFVKFFTIYSSLKNMLCSRKRETSASAEPRSFLINFVGKKNDGYAQAEISRLEILNIPVAT